MSVDEDGTSLGDDDSAEADTEGDGFTEGEGDCDDQKASVHQPGREPPFSVTSSTRTAMGS